MKRTKAWWKSLPDKPRRVLTFILGILLIITSALVGWIPGPGGMVPFLLGIAVLASEFTWAERLRDRILDTLRETGNWLREHPLRGSFGIAMMITLGALVAYGLYTRTI